MFFSEAFDYVEMIQRAEMHGYLMQAYIVQNPHSQNPKKMIEQMQAQLDNLAGVSTYATDPNAKPDKGAFDTLKKALNKK